MSLAQAPSSSAAPREQAERWRAHSLMIRRARIALPAAIGAIFVILIGFVIHGSIVGAKAKPQDADAPIQLVNPRFVGRDGKGRAYVITAKTATRDEKDYNRVLLDTPMLVLDEEGSNPTRISAQSGVYREDAHTLNLDGGVKLNGGDVNFSTASSIFNTATGVLEGQGEIQGMGALGEIIAKSYGVYDKGDRLVFKGGVRTRVESH